MKHKHGILDLDKCLRYRRYVHLLLYVPFDVVFESPSGVNTSLVTRCALTSQRDKLLVAALVVGGETLITNGICVVASAVRWSGSKW